MSVEGPRPHTGRRRNDAARTAILDAALDLLTGPDPTTATVDTIAAAAGVGKQTIYRWWPSKGAVLLDAMTERASQAVPAPDTGTLDGDLAAFLAATFAGVTTANAAAVLRLLVAEAQRDPSTARLFRAFTQRRRDALRSVIARHQGESLTASAVDLLVDQAFGLLWYRLLTGHGELTSDTATQLAAGLLRQAGPRGGRGVPEHD